jgi:hypothetical protein
MGGPGAVGGTLTGIRGPDSRARPAGLMIEHGVWVRKDGATGRKRLDEDFFAITAVLQAGRRLIWAGASAPPAS